MAPDDVKYLFIYFMITVAAGKLHRLHCHEPGRAFALHGRENGLLTWKVYAEVPLNSVRGMYPFWPHVPAGESLSANEHAKPAIKDIPILRFSPVHGTAWRRFIIFQYGFSWRLE